jgi:hypothetical protein
VIYLPMVVLFGIFAGLSLRTRRSSTWDVFVFVGFGFFLGATLVGAALGSEIFGFLGHLNGTGK